MTSPQLKNDYIIDPELQKKFSALENALSSLKTFVLMTHKNPDGDAIGSVLALKKFLTDSRHKVFIYTDEDIALTYPFLHEWSPIVKKLGFFKFDCLINLDRGANLNEIEKLDEEARVINIDHHPDGANPLAHIDIVLPYASATSEIIYDFFKFTRYKFSSLTSFCLLAGIFCDTGGFKHSNTNQRVLEIAAELIRPGSSIENLGKVKNNSLSLNTLRLWGIALNRAEVKPNGAIVTFITQRDFIDCQTSEEDIGLISELLNTVPEARFSLVLSERKNNLVKGSLRSEKHKGVDVSEIAHSFGGGGHKLAAGFSLNGRLKKANEEWKVV